MQILCSLLLAIGGALLIASEASHGRANKYAVIGRFLAGVTHGLVLHTVIIHSGEMGTRNTRRLVMRPIGFCILIGIAAHYAIYKIMNHANDHFVLPGIISMVLAVVALALSLIFTYESVPWLIRIVNNIPLALQTWLVLQNESDTNPQSRAVQNFLDLKQEIEEADRLSKNILRNRNIGILFKAIIIRILAGIVTNPAVFVLITLAENKDTFDTFVGIIIRVLFAIIFLYIFFDKMTKNKDNIWAIVWLGIKLVVLNVCYMVEWSNWGTTLLWYLTLTSFYIAPPIFDYTGHVYLSEVFPFPKKDWSLANVLIIEYSVHIALIGVAMFIPIHQAHVELLAIGALITVLGLIVSILANEAELLMLREERVEKALSTATPLRPIPVTTQA